MKTHLLVFALACLSLNAAAESPHASFDFKGLALSSTEQELLAKFPDFRCRDPKDERQRRMADRICSASPGLTCQPNTWCENDPEKPWNYGGLRSKNVIAMFYSGALYGISVAIHPDQFQQLVEALRVKYGPEAELKTELLQTRMGATFQNQQFIWQSKDATITAAKYTSSINEGAIRYNLKSSVQEYAKRAIQNRNKAADQL